MDLLDTLIEIETRFWTHGPDYHDEHMADDALMVFPGVGLMDRAASLEAVAGGQRWSSVEIRDAVLTRLTDDAAVLAYGARASRGEEAYTSLVSSAYVRRDGRWRLAVHQQSPT